MKKYQLPKEFAQKWIEALRSGEYGQVIGLLKNPYKNQYCCLGVACKIAGAKVFNPNGWIPLTSVPKTIPDILRGSNRDSTLVNKLSDMNDKGKTFTEIADWIEANVDLV